MEGQELLDKARAVAGALGNGWTVPATCEFHTWIVPIDGPGGEHVTMQCPRYQRGKERLSFDGSMPNGLSQFRAYKDSMLTITVAADRPVEAVAREIERRLLPAYREQLATARARKAQHDESVGKVREASEKLLAVGLPGLARLSNGACASGYDGFGTLYLGKGSPFHGEVKVSLGGGFGGIPESDPCVEVKVSYLTLAEAETILRVLAQRPVAASAE